MAFEIFSLDLNRLIFWLLVHKNDRLIRSIVPLRFCTPDEALVKLVQCVASKPSVLNPSKLLFGGGMRKIMGCHHNQQLGLINLIKSAQKLLWLHKYLISQF